jgi:hypothetical protein
MVVHGFTSLGAARRALSRSIYYVFMPHSSSPTVKPLLAPVPVRPLRRLAIEAAVPQQRLRTAARSGQLPVVVVGKRMYSTSELVAALLTPKPLPVPNP